MPFSHIDYITIFIWKKKIIQNAHKQKAKASNMNSLVGNNETFLPSLGPFTAPTTFWGTGVILLQCVVIATAGINEVHNPTQYSKFANQQTTQLPSMYGMLLLYGPSAIVATLFTILSVSTDHDATCAPTVASICLALHFGKRVAESLFLHEYSGTMDLSTSIAIGTYYALSSFLIMGTAAPLDQVQKLPQRLGLVFFIIGELGNLYHHYLLRQLRTNKQNSTKDDKDKKKRYVPPQGGLFRFVAAPHYMFEIIAFLGIALTAHSLHALLVALGMGSYLAGRAILTHRFYAKTFDKSEWNPRQIKAMIPFIF